MSSQEANDGTNKRDHDKKRARRTRKHEDGRDFICPCGKSYLSYPALYTHTKTKHGGITPPKCNESEVQKPSQKQELQQIKLILNKFYPSGSKNSSLKELSLALTKEEREYIIPLLEQWQIQQKSGIQKRSLISAKKTFGKFVYDMNKRVSLSAIKFLVKLMMQIHKGICTEKQNPNYCQQCSASLIPSVFNQLIVHNHIEISSESSDKIMQDAESVFKILVYFCNWLFNERYTNYHVRYRF